MVWVEFIACVLIILYAGNKTAQYADVVAEKTRLGRLWVGMLILAIVTSMPELVTSVSSVGVIHDPNLGLGTLIGTCIFNLCILVIIDISHRDKPVISVASRKHIKAIVFGSLFAIIIGAGIVFSDQLSHLNLSNVGLPGITILIIYAVMLWQFSKQRRETAPDSSLLRYTHTSGRDIWWKLTLSAIAIIGAGIWLSTVGDRIAEMTGWGTSFVGSLLMAVTTSLPEVTVAFASIRLGSIDLAVGDVLGANMLDLTYVFAIDLAYGRELILQDVSRANLVSLALLTAMYVVLFIAFIFPAKRKVFGIASWYSPLLLCLYIVGAYLLFLSSHTI